MILYFYFVIVFYNCYVMSSLTYNFERQNKFGPGRSIISLDWKAYPEPLPSSSTPAFVRSPYKSLYQGLRRKSDRRVYNKRFLYSAKPTGHRLFCHGMFDCTISHISVETNGSIPIMFRGGAGYNYFSVVIKARPFDELSGRVRAYCPQTLAEEKPFF